MTMNAFMDDVFCRPTPWRGLTCIICLIYIKLEIAVIGSIFMANISPIKLPQITQIISILLFIKSVNLWLLFIIMTFRRKLNV